MQVGDSSMILEQLAGIDMLTQDGDVNSVSKTFNQVVLSFFLHLRNSINQ